jgi:TatD DNase family protein
MDNPREVLMRAKEACIDQIINICTDLKTLQKGIELEKEFPWMKNAAATTPHDVIEHGEKEWEAFSKAARSGALTALGETGLDFYYERAPRRLQEELLARYCALALECDLPLIIHCREAFERFYELMRSEYFKKPGARGGDFALLYRQVRRGCPRDQ